MISNYVYDAFGFVQNSIYAEVRAQQFTEVEGEKGAGGPQERKEIPFKVAFTAALLDVALETLKPLAIAIESLALTIFSAGVGVFSLAKGDVEGAKRGLRLAIFNLNKTLENAVLFPIYVALSPLFIFAQTWMMYREKESAQPMSVQFSTPVKEWEESLDNEETWIYKDVIEFAQNKFDREKISTDKREQDIEMQEFTRDSTAEKDESEYGDFRAKEPGVASRIVRAVPLSIADTVMSVFRPAVGSIESLLEGVIFGILRLMGSNSMEDFRSLSAELNFAARSIAQLATKVAMSPITLFGQFFSIMSNPDKVKPSKINLYSPQAGDEIQFLTGKAKVSENTTDYDGIEISLETIIEKAKETEKDKEAENREDAIPQKLGLYTMKNNHLVFLRQDQVV